MIDLWQAGGLSSLLWFSQDTYQHGQYRKNTSGLAHSLKLCCTRDAHPAVLLQCRSRRSDHCRWMGGHRAPRLNCHRKSGSQLQVQPRVSVSTVVSHPTPPHWWQIANLNGSWACAIRNKVRVIWWMGNQNVLWFRIEPWARVPLLMPLGATSVAMTQFLYL